MAIVAAALGAGILAASFVLTASAHAGVTQEFLALKSTRLIASNVNGELDWASQQQMDNLSEMTGVAATCLRYPVSSRPALGTSLAAQSQYRTAMYAIGPGCLDSMGMEVLSGRGFTQWDYAASARVVLLGTATARALGITTLSGADRIYVNGLDVTVIGIVGVADRGDPAAALSVFMPGAVAEFDWRSPEVVVETESAATDVVAAAAPKVLAPTSPETVFVLVGDIPTGLQSAVSGQLTLLLTALGAISVLIGLFVIGNQTLQSVGLRRSEIALRRALGQPRHVVLLQIITETAICGTAGGFLGSLVGEITAATVALSHGWPPITDIRLVAGTAVAGAIIGALAGLYPAHVAMVTDPSETLKTG